LLSKNSILFAETINGVLLTVVHPAGHDDRHETGMGQDFPLLQGPLLSVAAKKGGHLGGRERASRAVLRNELPATHAGRRTLRWLPCGNPRSVALPQGVLIIFEVPAWVKEILPTKPSGIIRWLAPEDPLNGAGRLLNPGVNLVHREIGIFPVADHATLAGPNRWPSVPSARQQ
jgi:hypothetical protein